MIKLPFYHGMLTSNTTERVRNPERRMVHMSLAEMRRHLYDGDLLSTIRETQKNNDVYVRLPIYCLYKEAITPTWPDETKAFSVTISESANLREAEKLSWGTFTRVHLEVAPRLSFTPDSCLVGAPYRSFWYSGNTSLVRTMTDVSLLEAATHRVRSWRKITSVQNIYDLIT